MSIGVATNLVSANGDIIADVEIFNRETGHMILCRRLPVTRPESLAQFCEDGAVCAGADGPTAIDINAAICEWIKEQKPPRPLSRIYAESIVDLVDENPEQFPPIVDGVFREREIVNINAASKMRKSWLTQDLAFCIASGLPWLGTFPTTPGKVCLIDNELHKGTLGYRLPKIAAARGLDFRNYRDQFHILSLRGRLMDLDEFEQKFIRHIEPNEYKVIILDAFYRFIPKGVDENSNSDITQIYNQLDAWASRIGCAIVLIHHSSKGVQGNKSVTDVGSGAGAMGRAADEHIALRQHEEEDVAVFEGAPRSFKKIAPISIRYEFPVWVAAPDMDPTRLKTDRPNRGGRPPKLKDEIEATSAKIAAEAWTPERFVAEFVGEDPTSKAAIASKAERGKVPLRKIDGLMAEAEEAGLIFVHRRGSTHAKYYATKPVDLFTGLPAPMSAAEIKRAVKMSCELSTVQLTDGETKGLKDRFRTISYDVFEKAVKSHRETSQVFNAKELIAELEKFSLSRAPP